MNKRFSNAVRDQQMFLDHLAHNEMINNRYLFEVATVNDELVYSFSPMEGTGAEQNPFRHDSISMGIQLSKDITVMHHTANGNKVMESLYFHSWATGQRTRIISMAKSPKPKKILYITSGSVKEFIENDMFHTLRVIYEAGGNTYSYSSTDSNAHVNKMNTCAEPRPWNIPKDKNANTFVGIVDPVWYVSDGIGILIVDGKPAITEEEAESYRSGDYVDDIKFKKAYASLQKALGAV